MRILIAHSWLLVMSGDNRVVEDEAKLLRDAGHEVDTWTPRAEGVAGLGVVRTGARAIWSTSAASTVKGLLRRDRTQVLHVHNPWPNLSPTVFRAAAAEGVPVVMTLHNYRLASCLPATFLREGRVCEDCLGRAVPWPGVVHRCYHDSVLGSAVLATSLTLHRAVGSFQHVTRFVAVSSFVRDKLIQAGLPQERIGVKPNFAWPAERRTGAGDYFLYLGRLYPEKGVDTLLEAWRAAPGRLIVVGDGPEAGRLRAMAPSTVEFTGGIPPDQVERVVRGARAFLVPSRWYEAAPRGILEAYASGVPVVASDFGALPELVEQDVSGLLVPVDSPAGWAAAAERLMDDGEAERLGEGAWRTWRDRYSPERGLEGLESVYGQVLDT
jgi:glycosyltransferase involved in cell wall biosynthesis